MKTRSGKILGDLFPKENQPFKLVCLDQKEKEWLCAPHEPKERKEPNIHLSEAWSNWVHKTKKFREWVLMENIDQDRRKEEKGPYEANIDFVLASEEWRKNKIHLGERGFRYK